MAAKGDLIIYYDPKDSMLRIVREGQKRLAELPVDRERMQRGEDVAALSDALSALPKRPSQESADFLLTHAMYGVDFITLPNVKRSQQADLFRTELKNQYLNYDNLEFLKTEIYSGKSTVTYCVHFVQKSMMDELRASFAKLNINITRFLPYGTALLSGAARLNAGVKKQPCLLLDIQNSASYIAAYGKETLLGGLEVPFGIEALSDNRVVSERALCRADTAELLVINSRERAKSTKLTMAINIEDELIDDSVEDDESGLTAEEVAQLSKNPPLPKLTAEGSVETGDVYYDDEDDEDAKPTQPSVKTLNRSAVRVLPKFMRRPIPETPQGFVLENFRLFEKRVLLTLRQMKGTEYMPDTQTVFLRLPKGMEYITEELAKADPKVHWVTLTADREALLALSGAQDVFSAKLPVF